MKVFQDKESLGIHRFIYYFREESEAAIFEMLKDLVSRVKTEIEEEKK